MPGCRVNRSLITGRQEPEYGPLLPVCGPEDWNSSARESLPASPRATETPVLDAAAGGLRAVPPYAEPQFDYGQFGPAPAPVAAPAPARAPATPAAPATGQRPPPPSAPASDGGFGLLGYDCRVETASDRPGGLPVGVYCSADEGTPLQRDVGVGIYTDRDGETHMGANAHGGTTFAHDSPDGRFGTDGGLAHVDAGLDITEDTASLGGGASLADFAVSLRDAPDAHSDTDSAGRLGLGEGVGFGGRLHYGDADGDGVRELGLGIDAGPISLDLTSERLGQAWNRATADPRTEPLRPIPMD